MYIQFKEQVCDSQK